MSNNALASNLLMFHRIRNKSLGISIDTEFTYGLLLYTAVISMQETEKGQVLEFARASFLFNIITKSKEKAEALLESADTIEKKREIFPEITKLYQLASGSQKQLEAL